MDLQNITLFNMAGRKMEWLNERQKVVAQNIANSDTPGYTPSDLKKLSFAQELKNLNSGGETDLYKTNTKHRDGGSTTTRLRTTDAGHIAAARNDGSFRAYKNRRPYESSLDGNSVILEEQTLLLSENRDTYDRMATLYQKYNTMIKASLGNR